MTALAGLVVLLLTPAVPLVLAGLLLLKPDAAVVRTLAAWAALPALITSWLMPAGIAATVPWVLEGSEFGLDDTGRVFLFGSAVVWLVGGLVARRWVTVGQRRFFVYFLLTMSGSLGLVVARDLVAFYLFFSLMSFAAWGLVLHDGHGQARRAAGVYLIFVLAADMMIFAALVLIAQETGGELLFEVARSALPTASHGSAVIVLLILGLGVKAGVLGVHVTLPLVYAAAPNPAGVVFAGAMQSAGLLGWLRLLPMGLGTAPGLGRVLAGAGVAAAFYGALVGVTQRRPAAVLAYSSISQMGIMTMAVGLALTMDDGRGALAAAVTLYALHHAFAKSALFLGAGVVERVQGRRAGLVWTGLLLAALSIAGAPLTTGMLAKATLKEALAAGPAPGALNAALPWMAFATSIVLGRFLWLVRPRSGRAGDEGALPIWALLLSLAFTAAWLMPGYRHPQLWTPAVLWEVSWPVLLGVLVCAGALAFRRRLPAVPNVPPGDVLAGLSVLADGLVRSWYRLAGRKLPRWRDRTLELAGRVIRRPPWSAAAGAAERWLTAWPVSMSLFVAVILLVWLLTISG